METFKCPLINKSPTLDDDGDRQICLNCPLPECIEFSRTKGARLVKVKNETKLSKAERNAKIKELWEKEVPIVEIANAFGLQKRSVYWILYNKLGVQKRG